MPSKIQITKPQELKVLVRRHLDHRISALVAILFNEAKAYNGRGDISKAAQEGSYVVLRLFIEFLGVKGRENKTSPKWTLEERCNLPKRDPGKDIRDTDLVLSCFFDPSGKSLRNLTSGDFGRNQMFVAKIHRQLCKINAHFTYDVSRRKFRDRIEGLSRKDLEKAIKIVVSKLDKHFYQRIKMPMVVHRDLVEPFKKRFAGLVKSQVVHCDEFY